MITDQQGNKYYTTKEAYTALGVSRSKFLQMASEGGLNKYQMKHDKNRYYRVEDVEALKNRPIVLSPVQGKAQYTADEATKEPAA